MSRKRRDRRRRALSTILAVGLGLSCAGSERAELAAARRLASTATTALAVSHDAFGRPLAELTDAELRRFAFGNRLFKTRWILAPASVDSFDGLGPLYNSLACSACHVRDGRGRPPESPDEPLVSMVLHLGGPAGEPTYGRQLQDRAVPGVEPEGRVALTWETLVVTLGDGERIELRRPRVELRDLAYGSIADETAISLRVAPAIHGAGLLEAVDEATLLALADPEDADGDGVSGRINRVVDRSTGRAVAGRFGWKATQPSVRTQNASALSRDIGVTSSVYPSEEAASTLTGHGVSAGGRPEISDEMLGALTFYVQGLAVPAPRTEGDPHARAGQRLFARLGCGSCHVPSMRTGTHRDVGHLSSRWIRPYSDLLLHDMGPGLADDRPDGQATGREWRTPPLWGVGLIRAVNGHDRLLHDGRARGFLEAILWHGGEADASRRAFSALERSERDALLAFLESL